MKRLIIIILFSAAATFSQNVSPEFSELNGMEDQSGNTHLFYRIYSNSGGFPDESGRNDIYNLNTTTLTDSFYLEDGYNCSWFSGYGIFVNDFDIWNNDVDKFIYGGIITNCFEAGAYISRYDTSFVYDQLFGNISKVEISNQNDSLVYASPHILKSIDGGISWFTFSDSLIFESLSPFDDNMFFVTGQDYSGGCCLQKTTNGGSSFYTVDSSMTTREQQYHYDTNENHIYRVARNFYTIDYELKVSSNNGEAFSWAVKYSSANQIYISNNSTVTGEIYLADGKNIYLSADYGDNLNLYKSLGGNILGIYKKPNSDKLYAATKYKIYEITPDSIIVIKSLPIPQEIFSYYPLQVGNTWVYDYTHFTSPVTSYSDIFTRTILDKVVKENGNTYYEIEEKYIFMGISNIVYERIDSVTAKIYRFEEFCPDSEQLIDDLLAEVGDSLYSTRFGYCIEHPPTIFTSEQPFNQWGINSTKKSFISFDLFTGEHFLAGTIGLLSWTISDDNGEKVYELKGCVINGVVYGDTIVVSVEDETPNLPTEFSLSQNYPNPFNPSTKIKFTIPTSPQSSPYQGGEAKQGWLVQLKVYDVLGNEIATLVNEYKPEGSYEVEFNPASSIRYPASGIYFYQLRAGSFIQTKKMLLIK